jgi:RHS repeat-associated protein
MLDPETGVYCDGARWYDAGVGRFLSNDPTGFSAGDTNLQRYVFNDPVNLVDPTGEMYTGSPGAPFPGNAGAAAAAQPPAAARNGRQPPGRSWTRWLPHGTGPTVSASAEGGMVTGAALQFFGGCGLFTNGAGFFGGTGAIPPFDPWVGWPKPQMVGGAYAGGGGGWFFTNATCVQEIRDEFQAFNINVGVGPAHFSVSLGVGGDDIWTVWDWTAVLILRTLS